MAVEPQAGTSPPGVRSVSDVGRRTARYLFGIAVLSGSDTERITTGELGEHLDVAPASVTEMVAKLDDRGLVEYERYQGVTLTDDGTTLAGRAGWRFCVVATFFESVLGTPLDDETAFDIGVTLPEDGVFRLRALVGPACLGRCPESDGADAGRCAA
jgi:DtxR family Mn-dependent transcriptional regulator